MIKEYTKCVYLQLYFCGKETSCRKFAKVSDIWYIVNFYKLSILELKAVIVLLESIYIFMHHNIILLEALILACETGKALQL